MVKSWTIRFVLVSRSISLTVKKHYSNTLVFYKLNGTVTVSVHVLILMSSKRCFTMAILSAKRLNCLLESVSGQYLSGNIKFSCMLHYCISYHLRSPLGRDGTIPEIEQQTDDHHSSAANGTAILIAS